MSKIHTVVQGEYLAKIAALYEFADFHTLWDHPRNAALKQKRLNPNVLFPGDSVFIPDKNDRQEARGTDKSHTFEVKRQHIVLRVVLEDLYELPIANAHCVLRLKNQAYKLTTDGTGKVEQEITVTDDAAQFTIFDSQTPIEGAPIAFRIGDLDPPEEVSGQIARLANLGYYLGPAQEKDDNHFRSAVEEFQCDHAPLKVTGVCDAPTQAKLKEAHGC